MIVVYGQAGSGKTSLLISTLRERQVKGLTCVVLTPTHSSKRNIENKIECRVSTIYSFYRIDYVNNIVVGMQKTDLERTNVILIDEFSLIPKDIFRKILHQTPSSIEIIAFGDPGQLNPVNINKKYISLKSLKRYLSENMDYDVIAHHSSSVFSLKSFRMSDKRLLPENKRAGDSISNLIHSLFFTNDEVKLEIIGPSRLVNLIQSGNWTLIASTYKLLDQAYSRLNSTTQSKSKELIVKCTSTTPHLNSIHFRVNDKYIIGERCDRLKNGEVVTCKSIDGEVLLEDESGEVFTYDGSFSILPQFLITAHKSQGMTIENVIVELDDLFESSMLYTMVTRASKSLLFYQSNIGDMSWKDHLSSTRKLLKFYGYK